MKGGSDKIELWCVEQLDRAEKKTQNSIFVRPALHGANIFYHLYHQTVIWQSFYQPHSTGPQHIRHILSLF